MPPLTPRHERWLRRAAIALILLLFSAHALWGIAAPFAWGHYGYHAGFHGAAARNLSRHGSFTPTPHIGQSAPPKKARYLHHPIICPQYLVPVQAVFGEAEWTIRLVPVLFTLGTLLLIFWVGQRFWGPWAGVVAGAVFALLPHNMVFAHLYDHETPGMLYSLMGLSGFFGALRRPGLGAAGLAFAGFGLAGLTDWPPYFIAFCAAWGGAGYLLAASFRPRSPWRTVIWAAGVGGATAVFWWIFDSRVDWPTWQISSMAAGLMMVALLPATEAGPLGARDPRSATTGPEPSHALLWRWLLLVGLAVLMLGAFWFHFRYTRWVGMAEDVEQAFKVRSGPTDAWVYAEKYYQNVRHTFTRPVLWVMALWLLSLPLRLGLGRPMLKAALPLACLVGQLMHNLKFPNEVDIHNYRTYYFVLAAALASADLVDEAQQGARWLVRRFAIRRAGLEVRQVAGLALAPLVTGMLLWQSCLALPVLREGRRRSGTLRYQHKYNAELDKVAAFERFARLTNKHTLVLYTRDVAPRFEALWYLDRDVWAVHTLPRDRPAALRVAARFARRKAGLRGRPKRGVALPYRHVVAVLPTRLGKRHRRNFGRIVGQYPVTRVGSWQLVDYGHDGPGYRSYAVRTRAYPNALIAYLKAPYPHYVVERDLAEEWRTVTSLGLPLEGRPPLERAPAANASRYHWAAYRNARLLAVDDAGGRAAHEKLRLLLRANQGVKLSPRLRLVGAAVGHTLVELFIEAVKTHEPQCELSVDSLNEEGPDRRIRSGRRLAVVPSLARWRRGAIYILRYPLPLPNGQYRLSLNACTAAQGDGRTTPSTTLGAATIRR